MVLTVICPTCDAVARVTALDPAVRPLTVVAQCTAAQCAQSFTTSDKTRMLLGRDRALVRLTPDTVWTDSSPGHADTTEHPSTCIRPSLPATP